MNWTRGLWRLWLVCSAVWFSALLAVTFASWPNAEDGKGFKCPPGRMVEDAWHYVFPPASSSLDATQAAAARASAELEQSVFGACLKITENQQILLAAAIIGPLLVLGAAQILRWIIRGFNK